MAKRQSSKKGGIVDKAKAKAKQMFTGKGKGKGKSRKKGALWYAKEIQRLKLKKKYERVKFGVMR